MIPTKSINRPDFDSETFMKNGTTWQNCVFTTFLKQTFLPAFEIKVPNFWVQFDRSLDFPIGFGSDYKIGIRIDPQYNLKYYLPLESITVSKSPDAQDFPILLSWFSIFVIFEKSRKIVETNVFLFFLQRNLIGHQLLTCWDSRSAGKDMCFFTTEKLASRRIAPDSLFSNNLTFFF